MTLILSSRNGERHKILMPLIKSPRLVSEFSLRRQGWSWSRSTGSTTNIVYRNNHYNLLSWSSYFSLWVYSIMMVIIIHKGIYRILGSTSVSRGLHTNVRSHEYSSRSHRREVLLIYLFSKLYRGSYLVMWILISTYDVYIPVRSRIAWWEATKGVSTGLQHGSLNPNEKY